MNTDRMPKDSRALNTVIFCSYVCDPHLSYALGIEIVKTAEGW